MLRLPILRFPAVLAVMMIGGLVLSLVLANPGMAARRTVLFEESTSSTCPPCYTANPIINQFLDDYSVAQVIGLKWHVWWPAPGNDPSYLHNPIPIQDRIAYYQINAAPDCTVDGANGPQPGDYGGMAQWVENRLAIPSPIAMTVSATVNGLNYDIAISVNVEQVPPAGDYRLFVVMAEHHLQYMGTNGETDHYEVFRHMSANAGEPVNLTSTGVQNFNRTLGIDIETAPELMAIAWVQNYTTREVLNAATSWPKPTYYVRFAGGQAGVLNDPNTVANLSRDVANLGTQNDVYDIAVSTGFTGNLPAGWTFEYTTSQGTFTGPSSLPLAAGAGETITVEIDSHGIPGGGLVELTLTSQGDPTVTKTSRFSKVSNPTVIVYDDDGGPAYESSLIQGLDSRGISWGLWEDAWGNLSGAQLSTADAVFWGTGLSYPTLDAGDRTAITAFLNGGGKGFFNGQEIGWELCTSNSGNYDLNWYRANLHANFLTDAAGSALTGIAGDPIGNGLSYTIDAPAGNQPYPDGIAPFGTGSVTSIQYNATYKGVIRWDSGTGSQVVYMAHGIEGILNATTARTIVERVIDWFNLPTSTGVPTPDQVPGVVALAPNYPNPFTPQTSIPYSLRQQGQVRLTIYDVEGRLVRELVRQVQPAGRQVAYWDGRDAVGRSLGSGIYYYRLETPGFEATRSMVLVK